jgi:Multidrug resistance efflux pump
VVRIALKTLKYFSTLFVLALAVMAGWWLWNYYMQSPWTRDGKIRAEQVSITPQVSGSISALLVKDNQYVHAGDVLFRIDETPFHIAVLNAQAQLAKAQSDLAKANNEAERRRHLSRNYISAEDLDTANIKCKSHAGQPEGCRGNAETGRVATDPDRGQSPGGWMDHEPVYPCG